MSELGSGGAAQCGGRPPRVAMAAAVFSGLAIASCSLLLDFSGSAEAPVDAAPPDASPLEACDTFEPNDTLADAREIDPGRYELGLCEGDASDFLAFEIGQDAALQIDLTAEGGEELVLTLYDDSDGTEVDSTTASEGEATLERSPAKSNALSAGTYAVEIAVPELDESPSDALYEITLAID